MHACACVCLFVWPTKGFSNSTSPSVCKSVCVAIHPRKRERDLGSSAAVAAAAGVFHLTRWLASCLIMNMDGGTNEVRVRQRATCTWRSLVAGPEEESPASENVSKVKEEERFTSKHIAHPRVVVVVVAEQASCGRRERWSPGVGGVGETKYRTNQNVRAARGFCAVLCCGTAG